MGDSVIIIHRVLLSQVSLCLYLHKNQEICHYMLQWVHRVKVKYLFILYQTIRSYAFAGKPFICTKCDTVLVNILIESQQEITVPYITLFCYLYCVCQMLNYFMYIGVKQYSPYTTSVTSCVYKTQRLLIIKCHMPIHTERHVRRGNKVRDYTRTNGMPFTCMNCDFDIVEKTSEILNDFKVVKCTRWDEWSIDIFSNDV